MALVNALETGTTESALRTWTSEHLAGGGAIEISDLVIPQSTGMSMTTVLFTAAWVQDGRPERRPLVARVAPPVPGVFTRPDLRREFRLLQALERTAVPAPRPYRLEEDPAVLGSPFLVVEQVPGRVQPDPGEAHRRARAAR